MYRELLVMTVAASLTMACDGDTGENNSPDNNTTNNTVVVNNTTTTTGPSQLQILPSKSPKVRFKGGERWANQLGRGLELERDELCKEFGQYDCAGEVHFIALGGVEPYRLRIDEPLPKAPLTAPIAVERISLSACAERAERDSASPSDAVVFKELSAEPSAEDFEAMGNRLYRRLMSRDAETGELEELAAFWGELEDTENRPTEWATMACFALASSTEMLFY